ncbi:ribonuclease HI [Taibaiella sp. KBW10]|uniref:ribonuclease HI n=1 Tax=Taibaiella sp. KBW10 TaxID=2153357 RepID=UPI000F59AA48|nr:ribonuclease HI [Taibaiella sp. KBW10]RQO30991.1 ribonuclease HI [Taibaiella sp. KBW10]
MSLIIYTDGASRGNPGRGGYGIVLKWGSTIKEIAQGFKLTTNNRMELLAVIVALESLTREGLNIVVYSDSKYVIDSVVKGWVFGWEKKGYTGKKNPDLWQRFLKSYRKHHVQFQWVKGHADNPYNNRCDVLATTAADGGNLLADSVYEEEFYAR